MNRTLLAFMLALCSVASAQVQYPYNPDAEPDGFIGVGDVLEILPQFGSAFTPQEIMIGDTTLTDYLQEIMALLDEQSAAGAGLAFGERFNLGEPDELGPLPWDFNVHYGVYDFESDGLIMGQLFHPFYNVVLLPDSLDVQDLSHEDFDEYIVAHVGTQETFTIAVRANEKLWIEGEPSAFEDDFVLQWIPLLSGDESLGYNEVAPDESGPCQGELTVNYHGYDYELIEIGDQCWFAENLRATFYNNGDQIPQLNGGLEWATTSQGACCVYNEDPVVLLTSGRLYNWHTTQDPRGLCPTNWHVPSNSDFVTCLGPYDMASDAHALKASVFNVPQWNGTNESGFSALPSGMRMFNDGDFGDETDTGFWTASASELSGYAIRLTLSQDQSYMMLQSRPYGDGHAIRCIKDQ